MPGLPLNIEDAVRQHLEDDPGEYFQNGTAFFVAGGQLAVTSAHVVGGCRDIKVTDASGGEHSTTLLIWDGRRDVAVLRMMDRAGQHPEPYYGGLSLRHPNFDRRGVERDPPEINNPIGYVMTFGLNSPARATPTQLGPAQRVQVLSYFYQAQSGTGDGGQAYDMLRFPRPLESGTSGSPVLNENEEVVAMVTALWRNNTLGVPLEDIARAVQSAGFDPYPQGSTRPPTDPVEFVAKVRCR